METMEWAKQSEEMLKTWTETQKKVWDDCLKAMQGFGKSPSTEVWEKTVDTWNQTIQKVLDAQLEWSAPLGRECSRQPRGQLRRRRNGPSAGRN